MLERCPIAELPLVDLVLGNGTRSAPADHHRVAALDVAPGMMVRHRIAGPESVRAQWWDRRGCEILHLLDLGIGTATAAAGRLSLSVVISGNQFLGACHRADVPRLRPALAGAGAIAEVVPQQPSGAVASRR